MSGVCPAAADGMIEQRRKITMERIASRYSPTQKASFMALQYDARTYFNVQSQEEVNVAGSAPHAFVIGSHVWHERLLTLDVEALNPNRVPPPTASAEHRADVRLQSLYQRVIPNPALRRGPPYPLVPGVPMSRKGTNSREALRVDQAL